MDILEQLTYQKQYESVEADDANRQQGHTLGLP